VRKKKRHYVLHGGNCFVTPIETDHVGGHAAEYGAGPKSFFVIRFPEIHQLFARANVLVDITLVNDHVAEKDRAEEQDCNEQENHNGNCVRKDVGGKVDLLHLKNLLTDRVDHADQECKIGRFNLI